VKQPETILLAEDNSDDAELTRLAFEQAGFTNPIAVVRDGKQAVEYLQGQGPYADRIRFPAPILLLLDLKMPRLTGFEVLTWIRQLPEWMSLPIIILSASLDTSDIKEAYELGANFFLTKPGKFDDLVHSLKQLGDFWLRDTYASVTVPFLPPPAPGRMNLPLPFD
jgi:CheY-like chemotaxis protein